MTTDFVAKRRFPRVPSENVVLVRKLGPSPEEGFAKTRVVGLGGCMIVSDEHLGVGSFLDLLIAVKGQVAKARARVVYEKQRSATEIEVGMEFLGVSSEDQALLQGLLEDERATA